MQNVHSFQQAIPAPIMGHPPTEWVSETRTFSHVGLDFGVTIFTKLTQKHDNSYIALFVCMATKAIHLEVVSSLTRVACIASLRRFTARRDANEIWISLAPETKEILDQNWSCWLVSYLSSKAVTWLMIPARALHFGGLWAASMESCKNLLRKVIGKQALSSMSSTLSSHRLRRPSIHARSAPCQLILMTLKYWLK